MKQPWTQHAATLTIALSVLYTPLTIGESADPSERRQTKSSSNIQLPNITSYQASGVDISAAQQRRLQQANGGAAMGKNGHEQSSHSAPFKSLKSAKEKYKTLKAKHRHNTKANPASYAESSLNPNGQNDQPSEGQALQDTTSTSQLWNLKNVDIRTVISRVSQETGKNFVIDPRVQGKVTLVSQHELQPDELYKVFLAMLQVNGFSAVESEGAIRIIREQDMNTLTGPVVDFPQHHYEDENVVKVIHVEHVPVKEMLAAIKPLLPKTAHFTVYGPSNDVILSDRAGNVARVTDVIDQLDKPWTEGAEIIQLHHAAPTEVVNIIDGMTKNQTNLDGGRISLAADDRTNSIIMSGPPSKRLATRALIARLDVEGSYDGNLHVIYLKYTRARDLAPILSNIIDSYQANQEARNRSSANNRRFNSSNTGTTRTDGLGAFGRRQSSSSTSNNGSSLSNLEAQAEAFFAADDNQEKSGGTNTVQWEDTTNAIIIKAQPPLMKVLRGVIAKLDIRRPQVLVEAIIAEVGVDQVKSLGVEWNTNGDVRARTSFPTNTGTSIQGPLGGSGFISTDSDAGTIASAIGSGLSLGFFHNGNLRALVRALQGDTRNNVLATPNIITLDNETANIKVGERVPFQIGETTNNQGTSAAFEREEVGLSLTLRPQITQSGAIKLQIQHVLSNVVEGSAATNPGGNPTTSERIITTNVVVDNGEVLVLGGLIRSDWIKSNDKVPVLGNIPVIGKAFRSDEKRNIKRNLMVFIRPIILRDKNDNIDVTTDKYNHIRQLQLDSYREVAEVDESAALAQLDAPKQLPPPLQHEAVSYKQVYQEPVQQASKNVPRSKSRRGFYR